MRLLPAIDLMGGEVVRLRKGVFEDKEVYTGDPAEIARKWVDLGADGIHVVDLDGAKSGKPVNKKAIKAIVSAAQAPVELGGGVRSVQIVSEYLDMGVSQVILGTAAILDPGLALAAADLYPDRILVGIDVKDGKPATKGWTQTVDKDPVALAERFASMGVSGIIYTDISRDGMLAGANIEGLKAFAESIDLPVIASGGVTSIDDVKAITGLEPSGVEAMIIGKSLYDGALDLADAVSYLRNR
ncbi:Phosphoribosylformimino-5-aminoimidazole carboxamide ribotide isomerase [hydrothermal vent metagenome]|uniref:1-(5-phosphoribosyl)-5-[(5-phosphoribosylamino)methylideneamino]imidazole-4-carboxamideisomerase n=1 Tax=hydrothermal vent metagenome TaxID=652676 RepID=A0A3B1C4F9_9ZZZZ